MSTRNAQPATKPLNSTKSGQTPVKCGFHPITTRSGIPTLRNNVSLSNATGKMSNSGSNNSQPDNPQGITDFVFSPVAKKPPTSTRTPPSTLCYRNDLPLSRKTLKVDICSTPTYKLCLSYAVNAASMCTTTSLLYTDVGINVFNPALFLHDGPAASIAEQYLIFVLQVKDHFKLKERYSFISFSVAFALEYVLAPTIIFLSICYLAPFILLLF